MAIKTPSGSCPIEDQDPCPIPRTPWRKVDSALVVVVIGIILSLLAWGGGTGGVNSHFSQLDMIVKQHDKEVVSLREAQEKYERKSEERQKSIEDKLDRLIERSLK